MLSPEQRQMRNSLGLIGASAVPIILGMSPHQTPDKLWARMCGMIPDDTENIDQRRGNVLEESILKWSEYSLGFLERDRMLLAKDEIRCANLDGITTREITLPNGIEIEDGAPVEAKSSRISHAWGEEYSDDIPVEYQVQVMQQLDIVRETRANVDKGVVVVLLPNFEFKMYVVQYDAETAGLIRESVLKFKQHVLNRTPPTTELCYDVTRRLSRNKKSIQVSADLFRDYQAAEAAFKIAETNLDAAKARIMNAMTDADGSLADQAVCPGVGRAVVVSQNRKSIDKALLCQKYPQVVADYESASKSCEVMKQSAPFLRTYLEK